MNCRKPNISIVKQIMVEHKTGWRIQHLRPLFSYLAVPWPWTVTGTTLPEYSSWRQTTGPYPFYIHYQTHKERAVTPITSALCYITRNT